MHLAQLAHELEITNEGRWIVLLWLLVLGGAVGSFLNVVVYRAPRRISLVYPPSRCPACSRPIRWYDNVPVLGWLWLGGRCRDCGAAISPRYPAVEAFVALASAALAWKATSRAIVTLPMESGNVFDFAAHLFPFALVCVLVCAALIEFDGFVPPHWLYWVPLIGAVLLVAWQPTLIATSELVPDAGPANGIVAMGLGLTAALALGAPLWFSWLIRVRESRLAYATTSLALLAVVGGFVGDGAVTIIVLAAGALYAVEQCVAMKWRWVGRFGWACPLALVTLAWMFGGTTARDIAALERFAPETRLLLSCGAMIVLATLLQFVPCQQPQRIGKEASRPCD